MSSGEPQQENVQAGGDNATGGNIAAGVEAASAGNEKGHKCSCGEKSPVVEVLADLASEEKLNSYLCVQLYPGKPRFSCGN